MLIPKPDLGIIEGFYGRNYTFTQRSALAEFLVRRNLNFYIYAPKFDLSLRDHWADGINDKTKAELSALKAHYAGFKLNFGLGFSPLKLSENWPALRPVFEQRVKEASQLCLGIFCLLFDDMPADCRHLGGIQNEIIHCALSVLPPKLKVIVCPTFYSCDPILERIFGRRPMNYFKDLTCKLEDKVQWFWTGNQVISPKITADDLLKAADLFGSKPFIWDNYPVNDGKKACAFLHLSPVSGREQIQDYCQGYAANPMLEYALSRIPLAAIRGIFTGDPQKALRDWTEEATLMLGHAALPLTLKLDLIEKIGLERLNQKELSLLASIAAMDNKPGCLELKAWLDGKYKFQGLVPTAD